MRVLVAVRLVSRKFLYSVYLLTFSLLPFKRANSGHFSLITLINKYVHGVANTRIEDG